MTQCKDCYYWQSLDKNKPLSLGKCTYFPENKIFFPVWIKLYVDKLPSNMIGYTSPTQTGCKTFK